MKNYVAEEILMCYQSSNGVAKDILMHYGTKRHSGRYPWGSGDNPYQHEIDFLNRVRKMRAKGIPEIDIAKKCGYSTTSELRSALRLANGDVHAYRVKWGKALLADGKTPAEAARLMGIPDSSFRALMNEQAIARSNVAQKTADILKQIVDEKGPVDIGAEVNREIDINGTGIGISKEKLMQAVDILKKEGYEVRVGSMPQVTDEHGQRTTMKVLCPPGAPKNAAYQYENISSLMDYGSEYYSHDNGETISKFQYPASLDSKRIFVRYVEDGGADKDGLVELRRGVPDISLGNSKYSQVRILVDGKKYIKGMAAYSDNIPEGYDVVVNSRKSRLKGEDPFKDIKEDPLNPFGAYIGPKGQSEYLGKDGKMHLSVINKTRTEGEWNEWSKTLPSQFLSKQNKKLIQNQLNLSIADKYAEYEDICNLTNPTVKRRLLQTFAEDCDSTAVHLDAAALPRQRFQVILPIKSLKDTEVYAPNFKSGEKLALVRYPHGGIFEIPVVTVNNKNREAISMMGKDAADAIGINSHVAQQLSGADFDGDTVMVIPITGKVNISHKPYLDALKGFDPQMAYPEVPGMKYMTHTDREMGTITNLIMDMTLQGAPDEEVARAVKHSMVVIDAKKHKLNYKLSEEENGIKELKDKYQGHYNEKGRWVYGAGTIVTRAKSETHVTKRRGEFGIDPETGEKIWKEAYDAHYIDYKGNPKTRTQASYAMLDTDDPYTLVSKFQTEQELAYARYASQLKALANEARKEYKYNTPNLKYSPSAAEAYKDEVASLKEKLNRSRLNAPREREAQRRANVALEKLYEDEPDLRNDKKERGKRAQQYLTQARIEVGAQRYKIDITPKEWDAIQAGAITDSLLQSILDATDTDKIREYATPRSDKGLSNAKRSRLYALQRSGYTNAEIAEALNVPVSTVLYYLKEK